MAVIRELDSETLKRIEELHGTIFLHGHCRPFALALHQEFGWPLYGLFHKGRMVHVLVYRPDQKQFFDARGLVADQEAGAPFGISPSSSALRPVEAGEVLEGPHVSELEITWAKQVAELLLPNLPWRSSFRNRVQGFAEELEELSRKHRVWIRAPLPATPPHLTEQGGEYEVLYTEDGFGFTIDRKLP